MNKKGYSEMENTLIIIVLVLVAIGIVWAVVNQIINSPVEFKIYKEECSDKVEVINLTFSTVCKEKCNIYYNLTNNVLDDMRNWLDCFVHCDKEFIWNTRDCGRKEVDSIPFGYWEGDRCVIDGNLHLNGCAGLPKESITIEWLNENCICDSIYHDVCLKYSCKNYEVEVIR